MKTDFESFRAAIYDDWKSLASGIASIILALAGSVVSIFVVSEAVKPNPVVIFGSVAFWLACVCCFFVAAFRVWRTKHHRVQELEKRMKPKLQILEKLERFDGTWRVRIKNLSAESFAIRAVAEKVTPCSFPTPCPLTFQSGTNDVPEIMIAGDGEALINVFRDIGNLVNLCTPECSFVFYAFRYGRYEVTVSVFPVGGTTERHDFTLIFSEDKGHKFWAM